MNKTKLNNIKEYLKNNLHIRKAEIGDQYSYQGNKVDIIPLQLNDWWYGTIQIQGNHYKAKISRIGKNSHISPFVDSLDTLNSDSLEQLTTLINGYINSHVLDE